MTEKASESDGVFLDRLTEWQQGDFSIGCGDLLFRDVSELTDEGEDDGGAVFDSEIVGFAVISQTCDVVREPGCVRYVSVCPLVFVDAKRMGEIERGQAPRFGFLSATPDGVVVDFSRTMSVTKDLLVSWERQRGCEDERQQVEFARALETFFGRFAFPDAFVASVASLRKAILSKHPKGGSDLGKALRSIREFRAYPHQSWSNKDAVPVSFIAILEDEEKRELANREEIRKQIWPKISAIDWQGPFSLHEDGLHLATLNDLTAADYLNSYPLDVNSLSFARRYIA
ncbi:hypothetical protein [Rhodovulum sulfidophilum]|uniref:hypothetical protein n=1 Tax=Rhodovulum sulfidophilum TaxID=35806 RepID=UPI00192405CF|nr:hypothetical protein [Rhodovulum sulfidophilum]MBL3562228.1 hypothetical protein [Rhodovulum sulfidophilum]